MPTGKPSWLKFTIALVIVFGVVGLMAGGWMLAPLIALAVLGLILLSNARGGQPPADREP